MAVFVLQALKSSVTLKSFQDNLNVQCKNDK